jgi:hypothetical protein
MRDTDFLDRLHEAVRAMSREPTPTEADGGPPETPLDRHYDHDN